jgi:Holliday junction resolvase RusA-like endonuclease
VRLYTPKATEAWEKVIAWHARAAMGSQEPFSGAIGLDITFGLPIPESWSKRKKAAASEHTGRPDLDNLVKCVLDGFNGIVFKDDSQVNFLAVAKGYSDEPGVFVLVEANHVP